MRGLYSIISNRALFRAALSVGLPAFVLGLPFSLRSWLPPNFSLVPVVTPYDNGNDEEDDVFDLQGKTKGAWQVLGDKVKQSFKGLVS